MEVAASFDANAILLSHAVGNVTITSLLIFRLHFRRLFTSIEPDCTLFFFVFKQENTTQFQMLCFCQWRLYERG